MPTYTYKCLQCGMQFESFQSIMDPPLKICPSCHGELQRIITGGTGLIFKGSGFYVTDYSKKHSNGHKSEKKKENKAKESKTD